MQKAKVISCYIFHIFQVFFLWRIIFDRAQNDPAFLSHMSDDGIWIPFTAALKFHLNMAFFPNKCVDFLLYSMRGLYDQYNPWHGIMVLYCLYANFCFQNVRLLKYFHLIYICTYFRFRSSRLLRKKPLLQPGSVRLEPVNVVPAWDVSGARWRRAYNAK